jgi:hypothetical protein
MTQNDFVEDTLQVVAHRESNTPEKYHDVKENAIELADHFECMGLGKAIVKMDDPTFGECDPAWPSADIYINNELRHRVVSEQLLHTQQEHHTMKTLTQLLQM